MKLTTAQKGVLAAIAAMFLLVLTDVVGIINIPTMFLLVGFLSLSLAAHFILPSLGELTRQNRRRRG